jgi:hypothetical protein
LVIESGSGTRTLGVGSTDLLAETDRPGRDRLIVASEDADERLRIAVARQRPPFAMFERELIETGAAALHPVLRRALRRPARPERRRGFEPLDLEFDRIAAEAVREGRDVSLILVTIGAGQVPGDVVVMWLGDIRGQLRPGDYAAILGETEIGILLCGASASQAAAVAERLKNLPFSQGGPDLVPPVIGISTCTPDGRSERSIVADARARAEVVH